MGYPFLGVFVLLLTWLFPISFAKESAYKRRHSPLWGSLQNTYLKIYEKPILTCQETIKRLHFFYENHDPQPLSPLIDSDAVLKRIGLDPLSSCQLCHDFFMQEKSIKNLIQALNEKNCQKFGSQLKSFTAAQDLILSHILTQYASSFDRYSKHLLPQDLDDLKIKMTGRYVGIGVALHPTLSLSYPQVKTLFPHSPAASLGELKPGYRLVGLDKNDKTGFLSLKNRNIKEVVALLRGGLNTEVNVYAQSPENPRSLKSVKYKRQVINIKSKETRFVEMNSDKDSYLIVKLPVFYPTKECHGQPTYCISGIKEFLIKRAARYKGLVLDLRNNFGGDLAAAVDLASLFLGDKIVGYTFNPKLNIQKKPLFKKKGPIPRIQIPLVVVINGNTASAAEVFAGAVQHYGVGYIMGEKSKGKGALQTIFEFFDERGEDPTGGFKVTTGQVLLPSGEGLTNRGVLPNEKSSLKDNVNIELANGFVTFVTNWVEKNPM